MRVTSTLTWVRYARSLLVEIKTGASPILWLLNNFSLPRPGGIIYLLFIYLFIIYSVAFLDLVAAPQVALHSPHSDHSPSLQSTKNTHFSESSKKRWKMMEMSLFQNEVQNHLYMAQSYTLLSHPDVDKELLRSPLKNDQSRC